VVSGTRWVLRADVLSEIRADTRDTYFSPAAFFPSACVSWRFRPVLLGPV
jgi:hypothetical protein